MNNNIYKRIWLKDEALKSNELKNINGHNMCYTALLYASKHDTVEAQRILNNIKKDNPDHFCSIISEANSLIAFYLRDFDAAKSFASTALKEQEETPFAHWVLANIALSDRNYNEATLHYKKIHDFSPENNVILDLARVYILTKDFKSAQKYLDMAKPSTRKRLYQLFAPFSMYLSIRLLWLLVIFILLGINPYLFISIYLLTTVFLVYVAVKWGYKNGDRMLFNIVLFIQSINSVFFFITFFALLDKFLNT